MSALNVDRAGAGAHSDKHKHSPHHCFIRTSQRHREGLPGVHVALLGPIVRFHASPAGPDTSTCPPPIADPIRMSFCPSPPKAPEPASLDRARSLRATPPVSPTGVDCDAELLQAAEFAAGAPTTSSRVAQPHRRALTALSPILAQASFDLSMATPRRSTWRRRERHSRTSSRSSVKSRSC